MKSEVNAKTRLLRAGARIVHEKGFQDAGLQEILDQAQVPKGSFYFYFKSKEDFGLQLIDFYENFFMGRAEQIFKDRKGPYAQKIRQYLDWQGDYMEANGYKGGCPFGVLSQEMADRNEKFRKKLEKVFERFRENVARLLSKAREEGEIDSVLEPDHAADFIISAWQGVLIQMKTSQSGASRRAFLSMVFDHLLTPCEAHNKNQPAVKTTAKNKGNNHES